ncbi:hypothetical protein Tco_0282080 [Tanacetum coccineum]
MDWYRNLWIVLSVEDKLPYLEQPIPALLVPLAGQVTSPDVLATHSAWVKAWKEIVGLMLMTMDPKIQKTLEHFGAYDMLKRNTHPGGVEGGKRIRIWERGGTEGGGGELGRKEPSSPFKRRKEGGKTESGGKKEKGRGKEIGGPRGGGRRNGIARRSKRGKGRRPMEGESQIDGGLYVFGKLLEGGSLEIHSGRNHSERGEVAKEEGKEYHLKLILKDHLWWRKNGVSGKITVRVGLGLWERGKKKKGNGEGGGENGKGTNFGMDGGGGKREWKLLSFLPHWGIHAQEGGLDTLSKGREGGKKELSEDKLKEG